MTDLTALLQQARERRELAETERYTGDVKHNFMLHGAFGIRYIRESKADAMAAELLAEINTLDRMLYWAWCLYDSMDPARFATEDDFREYLRKRAGER